MASTSNPGDERFRAGNVGAGVGARNGSSLAGMEGAGASWRISSRNGIGDDEPASGARCCATAPGTCGVTRWGIESRVCGVALEGKLSANARSSVSPGMLTFGSDGATGSGEAAGCEKSGRMSSRNPKDERVEKSAELKPPGMPGAEKSAPDGNCGCVAIPGIVVAAEDAAGTPRKPDSVGGVVTGSVVDGSDFDGNVAAPGSETNAVEFRATPIASGASGTVANVWASALAFS